MSDTHRLGTRGMSAYLWEEPNQMLDTDDVALWYALNRLMTNYWADVDHNGGSRAHEFYLPEALFAVGNNRFEGPEKIRAFYARRRQHGTTTTRHLVGNLRVLRDDAGRVRTVGVMSLYRADGRPPFQWTRPPAMIADFEAQCLLGDDRLWRFQSHVLRPIFVGSDLPASISIDPQRL
jgi:SnoaL-like domain